MSLDAQTWVVAALVLAALCYLGQRGVRLVRAKQTAGCGAGCGDCPASGPKQELLQIDSNHNRRS